MDDWRTGRCACHSTAIPIGKACAIAPRGFAQDTALCGIAVRGESPRPLPIEHGLTETSSFWAGEQLALSAEWISETKSNSRRVRFCRDKKSCKSVWVLEPVFARPPYARAAGSPAECADEMQPTMRPMRCRHPRPQSAATVLPRGSIDVVL